jgi:hypothetical protein
MGGGGGQGLVAAMGDQPAYVFHQIPAALGSFMANIYFNPNGAVTSAIPVDIFTGLDAGGTAIFGVQFLHTAGASDHIKSAAGPGRLMEMSTQAGRQLPTPSRMSSSIGSPTSTPA